MKIDFVPPLFLYWIVIFVPLVMMLDRILVLDRILKIDRVLVLDRISTKILSSIFFYSFEFAEEKNNDAAMLRNEIKDPNGRLRRWLRPGDILILDRGYKDVIPFLEGLGFICFMLPFLEPGQKQFTDIQGNNGRLISITLWIVEVLNGHIKLIYKFFDNVINMCDAVKIGKFYRLDGALLNKFKEPIVMQGATVEKAKRLTRRP